MLTFLDDAFTVFFDIYSEMNENNSEEETVADIIKNGTDLFIVSPFNTVVEGMKKHLINNFTNLVCSTFFAQSVQVEDWLTD